MALLRKITFRVVLPLVAVLGAAYGLLAYRYWSNPPKLSRNFAAELNAPILAIPEAERAWPIYREAVIELDTDAPQAWRQAVDFRDVVNDPEALAHLRRHEPTLAKIRRASRLPAMGHLLFNANSRDDKRLTSRSQNEMARRAAETSALDTPDENPNLMSVLLQPVGETHSLVIALQADAVRAASEGDAARMEEDLSALIAFAQHLREVPFVVNDIRSATRFSQAIFTWGWSLQRHPELFDDECLHRLETAAMAYAEGDIQVRFQGERMIFYDLVQRVYSDDGQGDGFLRATDIRNGLGEGGDAGVPLKLQAPLTTWRFLSRKDVVADYDRVMDLIESESTEPLWKVSFEASDRLLAERRADRRYHLVTLFTPGLKNAHAPLEAAAQHRDVIVAVSAAHRYRLEHDTWPASPAALVPKFLPKPPVDRITGDVVRYKVVDGHPLFYSPGYDGDDDGGRPAIIDQADRHRPRISHRVAWHWSIRHDYEPPEGDVILWPVTPDDDPSLKTDDDRENADSNPFQLR